jgi:hypothetical protein
MWPSPDGHSENRTKIQIFGFHSGAFIKSRPFIFPIKSIPAYGWLMADCQHPGL